jgi:hypothetical protein
MLIDARHLLNRRKRRKRSAGRKKVFEQEITEGTENMGNFKSEV